MRRSEYDSDGTIRRPAARPKAKRFTSETLIDKDLMLLSILALWRAAPDYYITSVDHSKLDHWLSISARIQDSDCDTAVKISAATSNQHITDIFFRMNPNDSYYGLIEQWMKNSLLV